MNDERRPGEFRGPPEWLNDYVGLPYKLNGRDRLGLDCWGLLCLVWREQRGIELPDFRAPNDYDLVEGMRAVADNLPEGIRLTRAVAVEAPVDWDFVICYRGKLARHTGLYFGGGILHTHAQSLGARFDPESKFNPAYPNRHYWRWLD